MSLFLAEKNGILLKEDPKVAWLPLQNKPNGLFPNQFP